MNRILAALALSLVLANAFAASVFDRPADSAQLERDLKPALASVRGARTLRGTYVQHKRLHELPQPLIAEGTFLFVRDLGIAWRTEKPFASELVITANDILQRDSSGATMRMHASSQPGVRTVAEIFFAVFALDFDRLGERFERFSLREGGRWQLGLKPRDGQGGAIREIVVSGRTQVDHVRLAEANGDSTDLALHGTPSAEGASAEEQQRFKP
jgi:hypothetical protein